MDVGEYTENLQREGDLLAESIATVDPGATVPTCPEWQVRDLVRHLGGIHRWAAGIVRDGQTAPIDLPLEQIAGGWPGDADLVDWFRDGHRALVRTLTDADRDLECWAFLPAPSPLLFWARRQTHETAVHRVDAQGTTGAVTPIGAAQAADGIDEFLGGFAARRRGWPYNEPQHLGLRATDTGREWRVQIGPERVQVLEPVDTWVTDCAVDATASDLLLLLWNRVSPDDLAVRGDRGLLTSWRDLVLVQWTD